MPPMGTMNSHTTELQTPELPPTGLAPQGTRPEGLVDSDSKSVAASPNLSMALKWPIMCWCAVKKLLTHSPNLGTGNRHVLGGWDCHNRFHQNPFRGFQATGGGRNLYIPLLSLYYHISLDKLWLVQNLQFPPLLPVFTIHTESDQINHNIMYITVTNCRGLVVANATAMQEDPDSSVTMCSCLYCNSHCEITVLGMICTRLLQCPGRLSLSPSMRR